MVSFWFGITVKPPGSSVDAGAIWVARSADPGWITMVRAGGRIEMAFVGGVVHLGR